MEIAFLITGALLVLISLLIGYKLGKDQTIVSVDTKKQINQIFKKVVPKSDVGPIERPTTQQNFYRDNPQMATENDVMQNTFDTLNKTGN